MENIGETKLPDLSFEEILDKYRTEGQELYNPMIVGGTISDPEIVYGSGNEVWKVDSNGIYLGNANWASAVIKMSYDGTFYASNANISGTITATLGAIGGWDIAATTLTATSIILDSGNQRISVGASNPILIDGANKRIRSDNYVSGYAGSGFNLDPDLLEVGNIACRGIFRSAVLQYDNTFAYGGNQIVSKGADVLKTTMTVADNSTVEIENDSSASAWAVGDILKMDDANDVEWFEVVSIAGNVYTCNRDKKGDYGAGANPAWKEGAAVMNYGQSGDGGVYTTASEANAPYLSIFTHAGSPWLTSGAGCLTTRLRIGNLNGYLGYTTDKYGIGIGDATHYLKYDPTNHLRIAGNITMEDGSLIAGNITSKAIVLSIDAGEGDAYISGGAGLNYTNWTADKGFILGIDDSDGDKAKFFIGDDANDKYLSWYGTNLDATSMRLLTPFTAGEDLTTGDIVCIKTGYNTYSTGIHDSWVIASLPDDNFGTDTESRCGVSTYAFLSFDMTNPVVDSPINVIYAELVLTATSIPASDSTITLSTLAASFDESTVTYNTKPASNFNLTYLFGMETQKILATSDNIGDKVTFDVTQWVRQVFAGNETNNGFQIVGSVACRFASSEHATSSYRPYIKVYTLANSGDGKVYKSNCDDYRLCRSIMGVVVEGASADNATKIQSTGVNNSMTALSVGQNYYINSTDGELTVDSNQLRPILFGKGITATNILIEKQNQDFMSEYSYGSVTWQASSEARKIYFPYGTRSATIKFSLDGVESIVNIYRDHAKIGLGNFRIYAENAATVNAYISWGSNYLQVDPAFQNSSFKYIFYT